MLTENLMSETMNITLPACLKQALRNTLATVKDEEFDNLIKDMICRSTAADRRLDVEPTEFHFESLIETLKSNHFSVMNYSKKLIGKHVKFLLTNDTSWISVTPIVKKHSLLGDKYKYVIFKHDKSSSDVLDGNSELANWLSKNGYKMGIGVG